MQAWPIRPSIATVVVCKLKKKTAVIATGIECKRVSQVERKDEVVLVVSQRDLHAALFVN